MLGGRTLAHAGEAAYLRRVLIEAIGEGTSLVLFPGSNNGLRAFSKQLSLAADYRLIAPAPRTAVSDRIDFEEDASNLHESLPTEPPAHLVGHSYGGLTAIHFAALRPTSLLSLMLIEPAAMSVARGVPEVEHHIEAVGNVFARANEMAVEEFGAAFAVALGSAPDPNRQLSDTGRLQLELLRRQRLPWTAALPLDEIRNATYPKLILTSGSDPMYEAIADRLAPALGARREVLAGGGHRVHDAPAFNELLRRFTAG